MTDDEIAMKWFEAYLKAQIGMLVIERGAQLRKTFVAAIRAEREICAQIADEVAKKWSNLVLDGSPEMSAEEVAERIRAR